MRIVLTGAKGQLGQAWIEVLKDHPDFMLQTFGREELDITDRESIKAAIKAFEPDLIINCAAYTRVDQAEDESAQAFSVNATAVSHLSKLCSQHQIKLLHYSTDYVFPGKKEDQDQYPEGYTEDAPTSPVNVYGESKLKGEQAILQSGCEALIIRVSWLCGKHGQNFVKTMLRLAAEKDQLQVVDDQLGSPAFCADVVHNSMALVRGGFSGVYHYRSRGQTTWYGLALEIFEQAGMDVSCEAVGSEQFKTKADRPAFSLLSIQKINKVKGTHIPHWKEGLRNLLTELNYADN